jgi:hypothetical protein
MQLTETMLPAAPDVGVGLDSAGMAAMLLEPFRVELLVREHAAGLAAAAELYGAEWTRTVVDGWFGSKLSPYGPDLSPRPLLRSAHQLAVQLEALAYRKPGSWQVTGSGPGVTRRTLRMMTCR